MPVLTEWSPWRSFVLLGITTCACLLPFSGKAFHCDDPLFVWAARQIAEHPFDPYGFRIVWYVTEMPMWEVTKNPPLASYFAAGVGSFAGWSERALHLGFLLPTLTLVLGTYRLARRFTRFPLIAAAATLLTPALLVSASSVMSDTMMLAFWVLAVIFWIEGLDPIKPGYLVTSGLLIGASALTKYFGVSLIPLLFAYTLARQRRLGPWAFTLLIPLMMLGAYEGWTHALYGRGLFSDAFTYASTFDGTGQTSIPARVLIGLAFTGGCFLPALTVAPLLWPRKYLLSGVVLGGLAWLAFSMGWVPLGAAAVRANWTLVSAQLALYILGGASLLALAAFDLWERRTADAFLLVLWVLGTLLFAALLNWTINARSVLPLIPAAGILLARRLEVITANSGPPFPVQLLIALAASGIVSLWTTWGDTNLANSARAAARLVYQETRQASGNVFFQGHWGFQYYMQSFGYRPVDVVNGRYHPGTLFIIPQNNTNIIGPPAGGVTDGFFELALPHGVTTMSSAMGAGFYSSDWGPLPFAFGRVPPERYSLVRLGLPANASRHPENRTNGIPLP